MASTSPIAPTKATRFAMLSLLTVSAMAQIQQPYQMSEALLQKRANAVYQGCYNSAASMESVGTYMYQSSGYCSTQCSNADSPAMAMTNGNDCYCGGELPSDDDKVSDSQCDSPCTGFGQDNCGGDGFFSVYLTNGDSGVPVAGGGGSSSSSSSSSTKGSSTSAEPSLVTNISPGKTVVVTVMPSSTESASSSSSSSASGGGGGGGSNTAGIAAGVVVGVVALAAAIGGLFFWMRHKKRKEAEEEYKQRTAVSDFMRGANERKPPSTGYSHMSDTRLDPESGARRNSVGSLADNQDYSRRILRVANPDSS
ncbi:Putative carbohydrate-binding WSC [Septoria linicola]|uniref:Carbohydrate-binding WSC n=1 Tax=Septoria linicola TaxID=215465 RepID=A0A9Q9B567_9PEZI|nr:putative carbohydrate-binding WSC [Septoria linicola]USW59168.1 Putative carbohydrate-binding WSC [Septoria linicola]